jgi:hypothetical protein
VSSLESDMRKVTKNLNLTVKMLSKIPTLSRDQSKLIASLLHDLESCLINMMLEIKDMKGGEL